MSTTSTQRVALSTCTSSSAPPGSSMGKIESWKRRELRTSNSDGSRLRCRPTATPWRSSCKHLAGGSEVTSEIHESVPCRCGIEFVPLRVNAKRGEVGLEEGSRQERGKAAREQLPHARLEFPARVWMSWCNLADEEMTHCKGLRVICFIN